MAVDSTLSASHCNGSLILYVSMEKAINCDSTIRPVFKTLLTDSRLVFSIRGPDADRGHNWENGQHNSGILGLDLSFPCHLWCLSQN